MTTDDRLTRRYDGPAKMHDLPESNPHRRVVLAMPQQIQPEPTALFRAGEPSAWLAHDPGMTWPDRGGELLAGAVPDHNDAMAFCFRTKAAALACLRRLAIGDAF